METLLAVLIAAAADKEVVTLDPALIFVGILQLVVFGVQAWKLHQTVKVAEQQGRDLEKSIAQSTRAAIAMEKFAESAAVSAKAATESVALIKDTMTRQLRAYLCVNFFVAIPQNLETKNKFEVRIHLINVGHTPGYRVSHKARADGLAVPTTTGF